MPVADEVFELLSNRGERAYFGEPVSMTAHALQAAHFAQRAGAEPALVVAALLHDIGHLVSDVPPDLSDWVEDAKHEVIGSRWLAGRFGPAVSEPVRLHVPAKRFLCATDPAYAAQLSEASKVTLALQGGPMSPAEAAVFGSAPHAADAVQLRRWDDQGKIEGLTVAGCEHYRAIIEWVAHTTARAPLRG